MGPTVCDEDGPMPTLKSSNVPIMYFRRHTWSNASSCRASSKSNQTYVENERHTSIQKASRSVLDSRMGDLPRTVRVHMPTGNCCSERSSGQPWFSTYSLFDPRISRASERWLTSTSEHEQAARSRDIAAN